ncbi:MAG: sialidase family protein [Mycobacteriales bacterium]
MRLSRRQGPLSRPVGPAVASAAAAFALVLAAAAPADANVALTRVSTDPYSNSSSQHRTEVEPDTFTFGSTIVSAFQVGRIFGGGAANIGFATSTDSGVTWTSGFLPGITTVAGGTFAAVSDPSVAYDARHNVWLISSLPISASGSTGGVVTSRSTDGGRSWGNPVTTTTGQVDKNWIACDNTASSPFYGNCYTEYDITSSGNAIRLRASTDGGLSWGPARASGDSATGLGGQPVVRPNGTVIMPYLASSGQIRSFRSIDGGASWRASVLVATPSKHAIAGGLRAGADLPSAEVDAAGTVYVAFYDCRFRSGCPANDIVLSKSTSETTWAAPVRVPIDPTTSTADHFVPGLGVDRTTSGSTARIGLTYYSYPNAACTASTCQLNVGYLSSTNGGTSWSAATQVAGPMSLSWLPNTSQGRMFGDYISTSVLPGGRAYPVVAVANPPSGTVFDLAMYAPAGGLPVTGGTARVAVATPARIRAALLPQVVTVR